MTNTIDLIAANAKIEANHELSGSHTKKTASCSHRLGNNDNFSGKSKWDGSEVSPLAFISPLAYKLIVHLKDEVVTQEQIQGLDPNLRVTKGLYMIKYIPTTDKRRKKGRPFCIGQDLIRMGVYVAGVRHWNYMCDRIPELDWIRRNSTVNSDEKMQGMMNLAVKHPGMTFWFSVDWLGYYDKLLAKAGTDIEKPYGAWKCSAEEYNAKYKGKETIKRTIADVRKVVQDIDKLEAVQEEMMEATGEVGYSFEQEPMPRDAKTGQFISRVKENA